MIFGGARRLRRLVADIAPLRASRDFRLLFASRTVTLFGSQATEVALLVQAKQLTGLPRSAGCSRPGPARWRYTSWTR